MGEKDLGYLRLVVSSAAAAAAAVVAAAVEALVFDLSAADLSFD